MPPPRVVLFPYGQPPKAAHRDACAEFLLRAGGDLSRLIDGPFRNIETFCGYVRRIDGVADGSRPPIIVVTRTNPLALSVVHARRKIEAAIEALRAATWVLFVDPHEDPFFGDNARRIGNLQEAAGRWQGPEGTDYVILYGPPASAS